MQNAASGAARGTLSPIGARRDPLARRNPASKGVEADGEKLMLDDLQGPFFDLKQELQTGHKFALAHGRNAGILYPA